MSSGTLPPATRHSASQPRVLPLLQGVLPLRGSQVPADIVAGFTLAALAIPEVMGYTKISGTPVITGLYTILIPMVLFAVFGSSRHLVVGADSATAAILAGTLAGLTAPGSAEWVGLAGLLALMAAALLLVARVVRLGFLADFLSRTVLVGFLTGVGVQVALGELPGLLGLPGGGHGTIGKLATAFGQIGQANLSDLLVALVVLAVILGARRLSQRIPGALIAVMGAIVASSAFDLPAHGVHVLGAVPSGLPHLGLPGVAWSWGLSQRLLPGALAMSVVILAQSAATSRAYAARHNEAYSANRDLIGLALANLGAGLSGTFVVNGSPTKTQMVVSAGGHSQLAQLTTSAVVLLVLLFLTGPLAAMPNAVLSAVVVLIGIELIDIRGMRRILAARPSEFWVASITAAVVVLVGVEQGILAAMALSLLDHVRRGYRPKNALVARDAQGRLRPMPVSTRAELRPGLVVYRFNHSMYYANAEQLSEQVSALAQDAQPALSWLCIDMAGVSDVDFSAAETLRALLGQLRARKTRLVFAEVSAGVSAELQRYGLVALATPGAFYASVAEMTEAYAHAARSAPGPSQAGQPKN